MRLNRLRPQGNTQRTFRGTFSTWSKCSKTSLLTPPIRLHLSQQGQGKGDVSECKSSFRMVNAHAQPQVRPAFTKLKSTRPATKATHGSRTMSITVPFTHQASTNTSDLKNEDFRSRPAIRRTRRLAGLLPDFWLSPVDGFQAAERATRTSPAPPGTRARPVIDPPFAFESSSRARQRANIAFRPIYKSLFYHDHRQPRRSAQPD